MKAIRFLLASTMLLMSISCSVASHEAYSGPVSGLMAMKGSAPATVSKGIAHYEHDILLKLGGTGSQHGADGSSVTTDDQASLNDVVTGVTTGVASKEAGASYRAGQQTQQTESNNGVLNNANLRTPTLVNPVGTDASGNPIFPQVVQPAAAALPQKLK